MAFGRDTLSRVMNLSPQVKSYFTDMRFKPMPRYATGVVVDQATLAPGRNAAKVKAPKSGPGIISFRNMLRKDTVVGVQFIQPQVGIGGQVRLMDDACGNGWAVDSWGLDPQQLLDDAHPHLLPAGRRRVEALECKQLAGAGERGVRRGAGLEVGEVRGEHGREFGGLGFGV